MTKILSILVVVVAFAAIVLGPTSTLASSDSASSGSSTSTGSGSGSGSGSTSSGSASTSSSVSISSTSASISSSSTKPSIKINSFGLKKEIFEGFENGTFSKEWNTFSSMELYNSPTHSGDYAAGSLKDGTIGAIYSPAALNEGKPIRKLSFYWWLDTNQDNGFYVAPQDHLGTKMFGAIMKTKDWLMHDLVEPITLMANTNSSKRWVYTEFVFDWGSETARYLMNDTTTNVVHDGTLQISPDNAGTFKSLEFGGKLDGRKEWGGNGNSQVIDDIKIEYLEPKEVFHPGEVLSLSWSTEGYEGPIVIDLWKGRQEKLATIANVSSDQTSFEWSVDLYDAPQGNDFDIVVKEANGVEIGDDFAFGIQQEETSSESGNSTWDGHLMDHNEASIILNLLDQITRKLSTEMKDREQALAERRTELEKKKEDHSDSVSHYQQIIDDATTEKNKLEGKIETVEKEIEELSGEEDEFQEEKERYNAHLDLIAKIRALITGGEQCNDDNGCAAGQACDYGICRMVEGQECDENNKCMTGLHCFDGVCVAQLPQ